MLTKNYYELKKTVEAHIASDSLIKGEYWDEEKQRGCFIGCLSHSEDPKDNEDKYGIPIMVQRVAENIFEDLPLPEGRKFFQGLPEAIGRDGKDLTLVGWKFLLAILKRIPDQDRSPEIDTVIAGISLLSEEKEWSRDAAYAAATAAAEIADMALRAKCQKGSREDAYTSAARESAHAAAASAAHAAAYAAYAAVFSSQAAATSTAHAAAAFLSDAAEDVRRHQASLLLKLIKEAA